MCFKMDGDKNKKGQAKNKPCSNQKMGNHQPSNHSSSAQEQNVGASGAVGYSESSRPGSPAHDCNHLAVAVCGEQVTPPQAIPQPNVHRHSLNGAGAANRAVSISSPFNAMVRASSTGTLSASQSQFYVHNSIQDTMVSSTSSDFLPNLPVPARYSCIGQGLGNNSLHNSICSANSVKIDNGGFEDFFSNEQTFFHLPSPSGSSPPQNQGQAVYNWQATKTGVKERLAFLYNTGTMTDIQFKVNISKSFFIFFFPILSESLLGI